MSSRVRLLPTLVGAAGVLLCLRIGAMAANSEAPAPEAGSTAAAEPAATESAALQGEGGVEHPAASGGVPAADQQAQTFGGLAQTKGEADVLQKLSERRASLDARERDLGLREQLLLAAEKQVDARVQELKALEQKLDVMMSKRNEEDEAQTLALVKTYETMKPDSAARIFNKLDRSILLDVASRMKPAKIAAILAAMDAPRAQDLTVMLAKRLKLSQANPAPAISEPAPAAVEPSAEPEPSVDAAPHG